MPPYDSSQDSGSTDSEGSNSGSGSGPRKLLQDRPVREQFEIRRSRGIKLCAPIWDRAKENHRFAAPGESQWPDKEKDRADRAHAAALTFNEIHPIVQHLSGRQILDRYQRVYVPRNQDVRRWAETLTDIDRAIMEACDAAQEESRAFYSGPCVGGVSWLSYEMDFLEEPEGALTVREVPIWSVIWPADETRRMNLVDRSWHIHGFWLPKAEVRARWPRAYKRIAETLTAHWSYFGGDAQPSHRIPWRNVDGLPDESVSWYDRAADSCWIERYQYRNVEYKFHVAAIRPEAGEAVVAARSVGGEGEGAGGEGIEAGMMGAPNEAAPSPAPAPDLSPPTYPEVEGAISRGLLTPDEAYQVLVLDPDAFADYSGAYEEATGEPLPRAYVDERPAYVYRYALFAGKEILEEGLVPVEGWTLEAMTGYPFEQPDKIEWRSVVDALKDPQLWKNVFTSMLLRYMQTSPKGLLVYERGLFRSANEAKTQWARMGGTVEVNSGRLSGPGNAPYRIETGQGSPMNGLLEAMVGMADAAIPRLAGFNPGALGQVGGDLRRISGEVVSQLAEAAAAAHALPIDALRLARKRGGELLLKYLARFYDEEDIARVIGTEAYREVADPQTGEVVRESTLPPKETWLSANWKLSIQESVPAPDRLRAQFQALAASGGLELLVQTGAVTAEDLIEMMPDLPEARREKMLARVRAVQEAGEAGGGGAAGAGSGQEQFVALANVLAELIQTAQEYSPEQKQALLAQLNGGGGEAGTNQLAEAAPQ